MERHEIKQLMELLNDNEDGRVFTSEDWVVATTKQLLEKYTVDTMNIYGLGEVESLKEDISAIKTEVAIDADYKHVMAKSSTIELYVDNDNQYIDFETDHEVYINYKDTKIDLIEDLKESEEVGFDVNYNLILIKNEYVFTTETGLQTSRDLTIYVPCNFPTVFDEEVDF